LNSALGVKRIWMLRHGFAALAVALLLAGVGAFHSSAGELLLQSPDSPAVQAQSGFQAVSAVSFPTIAVAPFEHKYGNVGRGISELVAKKLADNAAGRYKIIYPGETVAMVEAAKLDPQTLYANRLGAARKIAGPDFLLAGKVREFSLEKREAMLGPLSVSFMVPDSAVSHIVIEYSLVSTHGGAEVLSGRAEAKSDAFDVEVSNFDTWMAGFDFTAAETERNPVLDAAGKACAMAAAQVALLFPFSGSVVEKSGDTAVVYFGSGSPVVPGDWLTVYKVFERRDNRGAVVWMDSVRAGKLRVKEIRGAYALCEILRGRDVIAPEMSVGMG